MSAEIAATSPFAGDILVCAPHMDDESLGCGMLIALHAARGKVRVLFASDGSDSPEPPRDRPELRHELPSIRRMEAFEALAVLGVPPEGVTFCGFPDGSLARHETEIAGRVAAEASAIRAVAVLVPFRYDRHPDHLALNRAVTGALRENRLEAEVVEYFVYTQWRLLGTGDVRDYLAPEHVLRVHDAQAASLKRAALARHLSQTTLYFPGQRRPILSEALLDRACAEPESFLRFRAERAGRLGLARGRYWIPTACRVEPWLKRIKDRLVGERVQ
jgi:LmbE family N-acetylglucosaminyl deacetylase